MVKCSSENVLTQKINEEKKRPPHSGDGVQCIIYCAYLCRVGSLVPSSADMDGSLELAVGDVLVRAVAAEAASAVVDSATSHSWGWLNT